MIAKNKTISDQKEAISQLETDVAFLKTDNITLMANSQKWELAYNKCDASLTTVKTTTDAITQAGVKALQEVQKAGKAVDRKVAAIDAMPKETCEDAFKILKQN